MLGKDGSILTARARLVRGAVATRDTWEKHLHLQQGHTHILSSLRLLLSHLSRVFVDYPDQCRYRSFHLQHVQPRSVWVWSIPQPVLAMEVSRTDHIPQDRLGSTTEYRDLEHRTEVRTLNAIVSNCNIYSIPSTLSLAMNSRAQLM